ncbi:MAG: AI-2E family transporter, partial [Phormidesmis priestleyi]
MTTFGKSVGVVLVVALLLVLWQIRQVLLLGFAAVVFATVTNKLVQQLQKLGIARAWAVVIALVAIASTLAAALSFVIPAIVQRLPEYTFLSEQGINRLQGWYQQLIGIMPGNALAGTKLIDLLPQLARLSPNWIGRVITVFTGSLDFFLNLLLVVVATIMLLANPASYRKVLLLIFPKFYRSRADEILTECETALNGWVLG